MDSLTLIDVSLLQAIDRHLASCFHGSIFSTARRRETSTPQMSCPCLSLSYRCHYQVPTFAKSAKRIFCRELAQCYVCYLNRKESACIGTIIGQGRFQLLGIYYCTFLQFDSELFIKLLYCHDCHGLAYIEPNDIKVMHCPLSGSQLHL